MLDHDPEVAAWTGAYLATFKIDDQIVPVIGAGPNAAVGPPVLSGHGLDGPGQVVLGAATLAQLHKRLGDTVKVSTGARNPAHLRIVGTATMPSIGIDGTLHTEMGTGPCFPTRSSRATPGIAPATRPAA